MGKAAKICWAFLWRFLLFGTVVDMGREGFFFCLAILIGEVEEGTAQILIVTNSVVRRVLPVIVIIAVVQLLRRKKPWLRRSNVEKEA